MKYFTLAQERGYVTGVILASSFLINRILTKIYRLIES